MKQNEEREEKEGRGEGTKSEKRPFEGKKRDLLSEFTAKLIFFLQILIISANFASEKNAIWRKDAVWCMIIWR
ncbi:MAG: hypothetical protein NC328_00965 [Muribaculum sp.]|nr:hypothetical protein [Muribaculum sp.]